MDLLFIDTTNVVINNYKIRDFNASLLPEVCHNVAIEPYLQSLNGEGY